jgi:hypothetical protein
MPAKVPDFATLASEALEAADSLLVHLDTCNDCIISTASCKTGSKRKSAYHTKRDKALKAIRGKK